MAVWRKVIVSGSTANLAAAQVDNLTNGYVVIGGGQAANLSTRAVSGSGAILADGASGISLTGSFSGSANLTGSFSGSFIGVHSGSFSGSFRGDGSGLTGVTAQASFALTFGEGIGLNAQGSSSYDGNQAVTITVSGAADLTNNSVVKWENTANKFANSNIFDDGTNVYITGSNIVISGSSAVLRITGSISSTSGFTGSLFGTASWASNAVQVANSLTLGNGLTGGPYNGSSAVTADVGAGALITVNSDSVMLSTASFTTNQVPKLGTNQLVGSNITDTGTQVQIGASATSGLSVAAGGVSVTGNSTFANNVRINGDLNVAGTASFENTQNLLIGDRFIALASGSTSLTDGGLIVVSSTSGGGMSGSAWYLESGTGTNYGTYGRWATAFNVHVSASGINVTQSEYAVTVNVAASSNPNNAVPPVWGGSANGSGNMWINDSTGDIFIYA